MARGQRSKGGQTATKRSTEPTNRENKIPDEEFSQEKSLNNKSGGRNRNNKDKHKTDEEIQRVPDDSHDTKTVEVKREHHPKATPQPTSEQLMIAQLIGGDTKADDPHQRSKIQKVMDITGKEEDAVATALFDAGWDENRAIELLLEDGEHLTAWEETGSKKRKNKVKQAADEVGKEEWDEAENFQTQDNREKSRARGPPRMRRGGSQVSSGPRNTYRDQTSHERDEFQSGPPQSRGGGPRRGDPSVRRGGPGDRGSGGRGGRSFQSRQQKPEQSSGGFSGSIDTWNNPPSSGGGTGGERGTGSSAGSASGAVTAGAPGTGAPPGKRSSRGSGGKDAFENAGNWGDDFPAADEWDNEEYTGSLADTKVFTARSNVSAPAKSATRPQAPTEPSIPPQQQQPNSTVIGQNRSFTTSANGPAPSSVSVAPPASASSFSQSIDLSTLLQKPTTQSSLSSPPNQQQSLLQFTQQATDSLRAGLGIGQPPSAVSNKAPGDLNTFSSYAPSPSYSSASNSYVSQGSAFTSIKPSQGQSPTNISTNGQSGLGNTMPQRSVAPAPQQPTKVTGAPSSMPPAPSTQARPRMPPSSKIPSSAVEMPGDNMTQLDVQFGGLDLKFVGSSSTDTSMGGFEYQPNEDKYLSEKATKPPQSAPGLYQPKEVNKSLTGSLTSSGPVKMVGSDGYPSANSVSNVLPKSTAGSQSNVTSGFVNSVRNPVLDMKSVQQLQQPNEALGNYIGYSYGQNKSYHHQTYGVQNQYPNQYSGNTYQQQNNTSSSGYGSQNSYSSSSTPSSGYKMSSSGANQYQHGDSLKFDSNSVSTTMSGASAHQTAVNNPAAVLGLTSTTNALSGKVSATTAGKVPSVPNLPHAMLPHQYMPSLPPAAFYGMQQPLYSAYGSATGMDDLAVLQRSAAGLHTLVGSANTPSVPQPGGIKVPSTGFYDPSSPYASSMPTGGGGARNDPTSNLNSLGNSSSATTASGSSGSNNNSDKAGFGSSQVVSSTDSNSSPIPSTGLQSTQQSQQQQQAAQQAASFNLAASNAFAAQQHMPPGYAYFYPNLQAYGATANTQGVYPATPMTVPTAGGGSSTSQFQKPYSYGYEALGQQGNKDFSPNYSAGNGAPMSGKSSGGGGGAPGGGHQYWGNSQLANGQLW